VWGVGCWVLGYVATPYSGGRSRLFRRSSMMLYPSYLTLCFECMSLCSCFCLNDLSISLPLCAQHPPARLLFEGPSIMGTSAMMPCAARATNLSLPQRTVAAFGRLHGRTSDQQRHEQWDKRVEPVREEESG
jgi:hypothetical protein